MNIETYLGLTQVNNKFFTYGAGSMGKEVTAYLISKGFHFNGFIDAGPKEKFLNQDTLVMTPDEFYQLPFKKIPVIVCGRNLTKENILHDERFIFFKFKEEMLYITSEASIEINKKFSKMEIENPDLIKQVGNSDSVSYLFWDQYSKDLFVAKNRLMSNRYCMDAVKSFFEKYSLAIHRFGARPCPTGLPPLGNLFAESYLYFHNDLFLLEGYQRLLDVGAFDGVSTFSFLHACEKNESSATAVCFEPDPNNFATLKQNLGSNPRVTLVETAIGSTIGRVSFQSSNLRKEKLLNASAASAIVSEIGDLSVSCMTIDDYTAKNSKKVTIIKTDPPGSASVIESIRGATNTIRRDRPIIIAGAYHDPDSIVTVPKAINEVVKDLDYKLFLRHLSWNFGETHVFAVPADRCNK